MAPPLAVVTGGAGFIGSHLCDRLLDAGWRVLALDDFSSGSPQNVQHLESHPRFELMRADVTQPLPPQVAEAERLYNLACPASPAHYQRTPVQTTLTSLLSVQQLLALAERSGARVFQASTSEVYGDPLEHPQSESYRGHVNPIGPRACYDEGKRCAETLCFAYHLERKVAVRIARLFNTYGPRLHPGDGRVVSNFIVQALRGEALTVYGTGQQTRSFCYIDDTLEGMWRLMDGDVEGPLNIGSTQEHTVLELAELVLRLTGGRSRIEYRALPADDPHRRCPDITRMQRHFGWEPRVSLEDGLRETIDYFQLELVTT